MNGSTTTFCLDFVCPFSHSSTIYRLRMPTKSKSWVPSLKRGVVSPFCSRSQIERVQRDQPLQSCHDWKEYSGTPLNAHPSTVDTHNIRDNSESLDCPSIHFILKQPLNSRHPTTLYDRKFCCPNCMRTILFVLYCVGS